MRNNFRQLFKNLLNLFVSSKILNKEAPTMSQDIEILWIMPGKEASEN